MMDFENFINAYSKPSRIWACEFPHIIHPSLSVVQFFQMFVIWKKQNKTEKSLEMSQSLH